MPTLLASGIEISDTELLALKSDLLDPEEWIRSMITGKIANCQKRLDIFWQPVLAADPNVESMPTDIKNRIEVYTARPDYEDRATRDAREAEERRVEGIRRLCSEAGVPERVDDFIERGQSLAEVAAALVG